MPSFLETVFGRKKPTPATAGVELAKVEAALASAPARIAAAEAKLKRVADLTDAEHASAEMELAAARRSISRLDAQAAELRRAQAEAIKVADAESLRTRADTVRDMMKGMGRALDRYDAAAVEVADAAEAIGNIDGAVAVINREIDVARRAGLDTPPPVPTSTELFRSEPDHVAPDQTLVDVVWEVCGQDGRWQATGMFVERGGKMVPQDPSARKREVRRVIPGKTRPGRRINSPLAGLYLPASRLDGETHWPRNA